MRDHAPKLGSPFVQRTPDRGDKGWVMRRDAGAVAVGIDLDHDGERIAPFDALCRDQPCSLDVVDYNRDIGAAPAQVEHVVELVRGNAYRIEQIADAVTLKRYSASFRVEIVTGPCGPSMTRRATSMLLAVFKCGRSRTLNGCRCRLSRMTFAMKRDRSSTRHGVSSALSASPTSCREDAKLNDTVD